MLVSVVMAAYDAERFVGEAVASVVAQTYPDWELLVVDDGSRDATASVAAATGDERVRVLPGEHVGVLGQVRNRGIAAARGDVVALLDADDVWLPRKLELQAAELERRPEVGLVHTAAELLRDGRRLAAPRAPVGSTLDRLLADNFVYSSSVALRREVLERHGAFDADPRLGGSPDYELWLRLAPHVEFAYVAQPLLLYRVHPGQMSASLRAMEESALVALEKAAGRQPELLRAHEADLLRAVGMRRCRGGLPGRGRPELLRSLARRPADLRTWRWLARSLLPQRAAAA